MQTNSIAPFLLTRELFPLLRMSGDGTEQETFSFSGPRWERYHQSKLANCTFTYGLQQRLDQQGITNVKALIAHPGVAVTGL